MTIVLVSASFLASSEGRKFVVFESVDVQELLDLVVILVPGCRLGFVVLESVDAQERTGPVVISLSRYAGICNF